MLELKLGLTLSYQIEIKRAGAGELNDYEKRASNLNDPYRRTEGKTNWKESLAPRIA